VSGTVTEFKGEGCKVKFYLIEERCKGGGDEIDTSKK
jgi:hypothetical protein